MNHTSWKYYIIFLTIICVESYQHFCDGNGNCIVQHWNPIKDQYLAIKTQVKITSLTVVNSKFPDTYNDAVQFVSEMSDLKSLYIHNSSINNSSSLFEYVSSSNLPQLTKLDASKNNIKEITLSIISNQSKITQLTLLNLSHNQIEYIGKNVFSIANINELDLSFNRLKELWWPLTLERHSNLTILRLNDNQLQMINGNVFEGLVNLEYLSLNGNHLLQLPERVLMPLRSLLELDVSNNIILQRIEIMSRKLTMLNVSGNSLRMEHIVGIDRLTSLEILDVSRNPLGNMSNIYFKRLMSLRDLKMSSIAPIHVKEENLFNGLIALKYLDMRHNNLSSLESFSFETLPSLMLLQLDENLLKFVNITRIPPSVKYLGLDKNLFSCEYLSLLIAEIRTNKQKLYFSNMQPSIANYQVIQGISCYHEALIINKKCQNELQQYFYTWHTRVASILFLFLAVLYLLIIWKYKDIIHRIKDGEEERDLVEEDDSNSSISFESLLEKEKMNAFN